ILTRSPLARADFDLFKTFGSRLLFGMSLPTLRNDLAKVYEPKAPAPSQRLAALRAAKQAGLHVFVAVAPTYPECDEADLRAKLSNGSPMNSALAISSISGQTNRWGMRSRETVLQNRTTTCVGARSGGVELAIGPNRRYWCWGSLIKPLSLGSLKVRLTKNSSW